LSATPPTAIGAIVRPLWRRLRLGEGGLVGMATWVAASQSREFVTAASVFVLTLVLLTALYLYNDVCDRLIDAHNPKKLAEDRKLLVQHPRLFLCLSLALHAAVCLVAWRLLGPWPAACATALLLLGPLYSGVAKQVPGLDVVVVGLMGGAVVGLATSTQSLLLMAAAMTGISHAFQTRVDARSDRAAAVHTSGTAPAALRMPIWLALAGSLAATVMWKLGAIWASSVIIPYLLLSRSREPRKAWAWARVYFALVWIAATI
jgi:4-hydroxybenzoate polyprenyltransferase